MTHDEFENFIKRSGVPPIDRERPAVSFIKQSSIDLPDTFDWRQQERGRCISPVQDQGRCGSCTAFAVGGMASDVLCLGAKDGLDKTIDLSEQFICSCVPSSAYEGCDYGGYTEDVAKWVFDSDGIPTEAC